MAAITYEQHEQKSVYFHIYSREIEYLQNTVQILINNDRLRIPELLLKKTPRLSGFASK